MQDDPQAANGPEAFIVFGKWLRGDHPHPNLEIKRVIAEVDVDAAHFHVIFGARAAGVSPSGFLSPRDGKVVERWDVIQAVFSESANSDGMF